MKEQKFGTWTVPESPVDIEYSLPVIDEIRQAVMEGFQRLSRGGIEVGGVLYGTVEGRTLRIAAMRPIPCEHAGGPTFLLSENDRAALTAQSEQDREDSRLQGLTPVGWFVSHTRSEITLHEADLDIFHSFFPEPWQVALVVRPGRANSMRAGFFVREPDGSVNADRSYQDFLFPDRQPMVLDRPPRERGPQIHRDVSAASQERLYPPEQAGNLPLFAAAASAAAAPAPYEQPYAPYPDAPRRIPWVIIGAIAVTIVVAVVGLRLFDLYGKAEPMSLALADHDGQLQIQWNHSSSTITRASSGSLEITDGQAKQQLVLTPAELAAGSLTYVRKSGDVRIRMLVQGSGGQREEASRYLGKAPEGGDDTETSLLKVEKDALQDEITRLRQENSNQAERIQQLERTLTVLRTRMGIGQSGR